MRPESGLSISETYDMKACRITTLFSGRGGGRKEKDRDTIKGRAGRVCWCVLVCVCVGGIAFAVQPHREVRPESGLVGIAEHIVVNKR